jgi:molybdenum cofactor biosynthesis enzyme MoaA
MKLDDIGFPTINDERARHADENTRMIRCDMVLTDLCTFKCPYCRGIREDCRGSVSMADARRMIDLWTENGLEELRFTGGEPTVWPGLPELVRYAKERGVRSVGISTNGFSDLSLYNELIDAGVNEFSISLDACDPEEGDRMSGGIRGSWNKVTANIRALSERSYIVLGIVATADTAEKLSETIDFALSLGADDIKLISASQYNHLLTAAGSIRKEIREAHPLMNYRITNMEHGRNIRGLTEYDSHRCPLVLDDSSYA